MTSIASVRRSLAAVWRSAPSVTRLGLLIGTAGVAADVIHHVSMPSLHGRQISHIGSVGHVLTLAGMVLALSGVVSAALASRRRMREEGGSDAARSGAAATR